MKNSIEDQETHQESNENKQLNNRITMLGQESNLISIFISKDKSLINKFNDLANNYKYYLLNNLNKLTSAILKQDDNVNNRLLDSNNK